MTSLRRFVTLFESLESVAHIEPEASPAAAGLDALQHSPPESPAGPDDTILPAAHLAHPQGR